MATKTKCRNSSRFWACTIVLSHALIFMLLFKLMNQPTNTLVIGTGRNIQGLFTPYSIKSNDNSNNTKHKLCAAVYATTLSEKYKIQAVELLNIYKDRDDVYFFLDDFGKTLDYKLCNILSDPKKCIWLKPKMNHTETNSHGAAWSNWRRYQLGTYKTRSVFNKIKKMRLYDTCEYIMKLDSDAYVDVNRFGDWLSHNFNSSHDLYFGMTMNCEDWYMAQGIYTVSSGVFSNREDLEFNETTIKTYRSEDCSFGYLITEMLKIPITDDERYLIYSMNQTKNEIEWNSLSYFDKQCRFSCHKCTGKFREQFVRETNYMPLHVDHCRYKGYHITYLNRSLPAEFGVYKDPNRTNKAESVFRHVEFESEE